MVLKIACPTCGHADQQNLFRCCFCGKLTCRLCTVEGRHFHPEPEKREFAFGFCIVCGCVTEMAYEDGIYRCKRDGFEWAPRAIVGVSNPSTVICSFCGLLQHNPGLPFDCAKCGMELV